MRKKISLGGTIFRTFYIYAQIFLELFQLIGWIAL